MQDKKETPGDDDNWRLTYPPPLLGWLVDTLEAISWRWTPQQILDCERLYPRLMTDIGTELWQRKLIQEQLAGKDDSGE